MCVPLGIRHPDQEGASAYQGSKMLNRRQLSTLKDLVKEYKLTVDATLVASTQNMAD